MKADGWKTLIKEAVQEEVEGKPEKIELLAQHLEMADKAKQMLRDKGYGWTGLDLLETAKEVLPSDLNEIRS